MVILMQNNRFAIFYVKDDNGTGWLLHIDSIPYKVYLLFSLFSLISRLSMLK